MGRLAYSYTFPRLVAMPLRMQAVLGSTSVPTFFHEILYLIISLAILCLQLIQVEEEQLSVNGQRMYAKY